METTAGRSEETVDYSLSEPIESLLREHVASWESLSPESSAAPLPVEVDFLVVGSGYGAAMAALALVEHHTKAGKKPSIWVFERGREYTPDDFPKTFDDLPAYVDLVSRERIGTAGPVRNRSGLFQIRAGDGVSILSGSGIGGTSLINASVAARPSVSVLEKWPSRPTEAGSWAEKFEQVYPKIEALLGVTPTPDASGFSKYQALVRTAQGLAGEVAPAPLSINFDGTGPHSVDAGECNLCGNCVVGCHSGAKQSLNLNAWPLFAQLGGASAKLYNGVSVQSVEDVYDGRPRWQVHCAPTRDIGKTFSIRARQVILAAGTIGSVDILKRSERKRGLLLSPQLGERFSTNGDGLLSSVGQAHPVEAIADVPGKLTPDKQPGPTIIGKAEIGLGNPLDPDESFTLEEGAIPYPLLNLWQEIITTQSFFRRFADGRLSDWHEANRRSHDYLCTSAELNQHSQVLLVMGDDRARGRLEYDEESDTTTPSWNAREPGLNFFEALDKRLAAAERENPGACFDGGQYHPNMLWKPLPDGFADAVEGAEELGGTLLSVHPIGGCCMGITSEDGAVDITGAVFRGDGDAVHEGLYVLDGAILPGAVGANPYMTIATTAYLLAHELADRLLHNGPALDAPFPLLDKRRYRLGPPTPVHPVAESAPVQAVFREHLVHFIGRQNLMPWSRPGEHTVAELNALLEPAVELPEDTRALVLEIEFQLGGSQNLQAWTASPDQQLPAVATLSYNRGGGVLSKAEAPLEPIARLRGTVNLGAVDRPRLSWWRALTRVFPRFLRFRLYDLVSGVSGKSVWKSVCESARIARLHADYRQLHYRFEADPTDAAATGVGLRFDGTKTLAYDNSQHSIWGSMMSMPASLSAGGRQADVFWEVDAVDITRGAAPLQVRDSLDLLTVLASLGGVLGLYFRLFLQTHFWSFGAADYRKYMRLEDMEAMPDLGRMAKPPQTMYFGRGKNRNSREVETWLYPGDNEGRQTCRLIRYQPQGDTDDPAGRKVLLLVHGLAHSSRIFWSEAPITADSGRVDTNRDNFVQYFLDRDYDVWIVDHRTSANYVESVTPEDRWDDIANTDIPWAVRTIFERVNAEHPHDPVRKVHVFSHCIGAGAVAIAALNGKLNITNSANEPESMLASLVPHAVAPWLFASVANRARENVWAMFKNMEPLDVVEPCPHRDTPLVENIFDRVALSTLDETENAQWDRCSVWNDERGPMFPRTIYSRYTIIWGRQWRNENINRATRNEFAGMIGAVPRDVLQQVYSSIVRGLLSNHDGNNVYVTRDRIADHWTFPTLFIHGDRNTVFDIETSRKSAEMLTRHRKFGDAMADFWSDITPRDYCEQNVWIEVLPGYGHMDMVLGRDAGAGGQVFEKLHRFFDAAQRGGVEQEYRDEFTTPGAEEAFRRERGAQSRVGPLKLPLTGPVISHPRLVDDGSGVVRLNLWVEAQDFSSIPLEEVLVQDGSLARLRPLHNANRRMRQLPHWDRPDDVFWLTHYDIQPQANGPEAGVRKLWLDYGGEERVPDDAVELDWEGLDWLARLRDAASPAPKDPALCFLLGSCLYPGTAFDREQMGRVFEGMFRHVQRGVPEHEDGSVAYRRGVDHLLLLGDQIYADATANVMDPITGYEKYRGRYRRAFGSRHARKLLSHIPSYFAVDDHECTDNFQGPGAGHDAEDYAYAREMAVHYQVHSESAWADPTPRLWHRFASAGYPFFVFDTRFERRQAQAFSRADAHSLMSQVQLDAFETWLRKSTEPVLFIASGSPMGPVTRAEAREPWLLQGGDTLLSYPGFLSRMAQLLRTHAGDRHVCWLSGDPHLSCLSQLQLQDADHGSARLTHICASGLYAPISFINTNPRRCDWDGGPRALPVSDALTLHYEQTLLTDSHQHFLRFDLHDAENPQVILGAYDSRGEPLAPPITVELAKVSAL